MDIIDYLLLAVISFLVLLAVRYMRRNKGGCRNCQDCQYSQECDKK